METAEYRRFVDGMRVDVDMVLDQGEWYARMHNDRVRMIVGGITVNPAPGCGAASPWCLGLTTFVKRYGPVAPRPNLGDKDDGGTDY